MKTVPRLVRHSSGASAAEFALVLPLLLLLIFGIIDAGRFMWEYNRAEKATQAGTRFAVVTDMAAEGLDDYSFSIEDGIPQGSTVPTDNFESATCDDSSCACVGSACGSVSYDATAFGKIVARMAAMYPAITQSNVEIEYKNVGLGYAGDPNGPDVAPLVTVRLKELEFDSLLLFGGGIGMPDFSAALTLEDGSGDVSN